MVKTGIVVLHGFNSSTLSMKGIEFELKRWGKLDQVINISYYDAKWGFFPNKYNQSTPIVRISGDDIDIRHTLIELTLARIKKELDPELDQIILLGHSMGGLVIRALYKAYIHDKGESWLGKSSPKVIGIIQLASPNQGSKLTNMGLVKTFEKLHTSVVLKLAGFSRRLINNLISKFSQEEKQKIDDVEIIQKTTQIKQMTPNSAFLQWLNSEPTFVEEIPHYRVIGRRNSVFITNLAWMENSKDIDSSEVIEELRERLRNNETLAEVLEEININDGINDKELEELEDYLSEHDIDIEETLDEDLTDRIVRLFTQEDVIPNDGLVSIEDAALPGSIELDLGEYADNISHYSILLWFLPFTPYRKVRDTVFSAIEKLL